MGALQYLYSNRQFMSHTHELHTSIYSDKGIVLCGGGGYKGARGHPVVRTGAQRTLRPGSVPYPNGPMGYDKGRGGGAYSACLSRTWRQGRVASITVRAELLRDLFNDCRDISSG